MKIFFARFARENSIESHVRKFAQIVYIRDTRERSERKIFLVISVRCGIPPQYFRKSKNGGGNFPPHFFPMGGELPPHLKFRCSSLLNFDPTLGFWKLGGVGIPHRTEMTENIFARFARGCRIYGLFAPILLRYFKLSFRDRSEQKKN